VNQDPGPDDGGSVVDVNGTKLIHKFIDTIDVSYFGVHSSVQDNSIAINKAINYANASKVTRVVNYADITVVAKAVSRSVGCIELKSNVSFENYGTITLIPNALSQYAIIGGENISNFNIIVGRIIGDNPAHQGDIHEHGMGIGLKNAANFVIKDGSIAQCAGDGMYLYGDTSTTNYNKGCYNGDIRNVTCDSNRRNGSALICCENIRVESCIFKNTSGKDPMSGLDIEPNNYQNCKNITVSNCEFIGNVELGLSIVTHQVQAIIDGVIVTNCKFDKIVHVSQSSTELTSMTKNILFDRCSIDAKDSYGINLINGVSAVKIENCTINMQKTTTNTDPCVGIRIFKSSGCVLLNNMIKSDGTGIFGIQLEDIVNNNHISNNTVSGFTYGIFVAGGVNNSVEGNYIHNITNRGIWNHSSRGSIDHNALFNIGSTGIEQNGGSQNTISFNWCFNTGTSYAD
ncbi:right-handed parallel beta-helix repeat-containing protein, partial [Empedobacter sp. UBA7252]